MAAGFVATDHEHGSVQRPLDHFELTLRQAETDNFSGFRFAASSAVTQTRKTGPRGTLGILLG